jgi:myo-inositol-1(or 4)-monophosphatase
MSWTQALLAELCEEVADAVGAALGTLDQAEHWALADTIPGQYRHDLTTDAAALSVLDRAGIGVLSEESGLTRVRLDDGGRPIDGDVVVVIDPVDGSTNASHRLPWFATSLCCVDREGPSVALVRNQASGITYRAQRGRGATRDGASIIPSAATHLRESYVALSGMPPHHLGWNQFRCLGACALDICAVAEGMFDAFADCSHEALGVWDYLGALLVLREAGGHVADAFGRELVVLEHRARRTPTAAATKELLDEFITARVTYGGLSE